MSHAGGGASGATPTSRVNFSNPSISTSIVQLPSGRSRNEKAPFSSVVVTIFESPRAAVTVAPGSGWPPALTVP